jgi:hypothetical protein
LTAALLWSLFYFLFFRPHCPQLRWSEDAQFGWDTKTSAKKQHAKGSSGRSIQQRGSTLKIYLFFSITAVYYCCRFLISFEFNLSLWRSPNCPFCLFGTSTRTLLGAPHHWGQICRRITWPALFEPNYVFRKYFKIRVVRAFYNECIGLSAHFYLSTFITYYF